jgi:uncharacterized membrane protein
MRWSHWYRLRSYVRASLWIVPFFAIPLEMITTRILHRLDGAVDWNVFHFGMLGARSMLETIVTASLSFVVFTFGSLLVAIQVASGQLTPRIIATTLLRNNVVRYTVGLFIFTMLYALSVIDRLEPKGHQFVIFVAASLGIACFAAFLYLIDYAARLLRPISIVTRVGNEGLAVIRAVYPELSLKRDVPAQQQRLGLGAASRTIFHEDSSEIVLAANLKALVAEAETANGVIEFVPQVGDFIAHGEPLFKLYGAADGIPEVDLVTAIAFGPERTMEQDPTFSFRIVIDIALRALSPAINDPTTAVIAIDQLHRLLRLVGQRDLRANEILDRSGRLRVIFRTPNWEDFVNLAFNEIRICGANNMQVVRRLRAMIENLILTLPAHRHEELQKQLSLLEREVGKHFFYPEDLSLAGVADTQGLGGRSER